MTRLVLRPPRVDASRLGGLAYGLIVASLIIALLILGREIIEPLVIAALLAFILSPLIRRLRHWGVWRVPSVVLTVLFALAVLSALGAVIALQITQLAEDLPTYETNLRTKIRALGGGKLDVGGAGARIGHPQGPAGGDHQGIACNFTAGSKAATCRGSPAGASGARVRSPIWSARCFRRWQ